MLPPLPRCSGWAYSTLISPSHVSLPRKGHRVGLHIVLFEACSAFTRVAACTLARSPYFVTRYPKASDISSPPCLLRLLPAGAVAGWDLHPLESAAFSRRTPIAVFVRRVGFSRKPTFRAVLRRRERAYAGHWRCLYRFVKADTRKGPIKDYATFGPKRACHHWGLEIYRSQNRVHYLASGRASANHLLHLCLYDAGDRLCCLASRHRRCRHARCRP